MITKYKIYEQNSQEKYNVGDYIMINAKKVDKNLRSGYSNNYDYGKAYRRFRYSIDPEPKDDGSITFLRNQNVPGQIIMKLETPPVGSGKYHYKVKFSNDRTYNFTKDEILRLLTPNEIDDFLIKKNMRYFNL